MTKEEVVTLDDALHYDSERCTETLKELWEHTKSAHPDRTPALQVLILQRALVKGYSENRDMLFSLMNAVLHKFLLPELTPEEQYSVRMCSLKEGK